MGGASREVPQLLSGVSSELERLSRTVHNVSQKLEQQLLVPERPVEEAVKQSCELAVAHARRWSLDSCSRLATPDSCAAPPPAPAPPAPPEAPEDTEGFPEQDQQADPPHKRSGKTRKLDKCKISFAADATENASVSSSSIHRVREEEGPVQEDEVAETMKRLHAELANDEQLRCRANSSKVPITLLRAVTSRMPGRSKSDDIFGSSVTATDEDEVADREAEAEEEDGESRSPGRRRASAPAAGGSSPHSMSATPRRTAEWRLGGASSATLTVDSVASPRWTDTNLWRINVGIEEAAESLRGLPHTREEEPQPPTRCILHPYGRACFAWEICGGLLIAWDIFMAPMQVFGLYFLQLTAVFRIVIACYWTADLHIRFFIGYEENGFLVLEWRRVALRFVRTWFLPDMLSVAMDWASITGGTKFRFSRSWHLARVARVVVITARLAKMMRLLRTSIDSIYTEEMLMATKVFYLIISLMLTAHYVACYFYYLGEDGWVVQSGVDPTDFWYLYIICFQWSLAQLGLADSDVTLVRADEQLYASGVILLGLLVLPATTSSITMWLMQVREADYERVMQLTQLRKYLKAHSVSLQLANRAFHFFRHNYQKCTKPLQEHDVRFLCNLPTAMQARIHAEVYLPILRWHPAFSKLASISREAVMAICHVAMTGKNCSAGEELFVKGEDAGNMIFLVSGLLHYYPKMHRCIPTTIEPGACIAEAALWCRYRHHGNLVAATASELVLLNAGKFKSVLSLGEDRDWPVAPLHNYARLIIGEYVDSGGELLMGDYMAGNRQPDLWDLNGVGQIAEQAFAPFGRGASRMVNIPSPVRSFSEWTLFAR